MEAHPVKNMQALTVDNRLLSLTLWTLPFVLKIFIFNSKNIKFINVLKFM